MARTKYDWDLWFIQGQFTIYKGKNYHTSQSTMSQSIRNNANMRGLRVSITDKGDSLVVTVIGVGKNGISHTDKATVLTEPKSELEGNGKNKETAEESNVLQSTKRTVSKTSTDNNNKKVRAKKAR